MSFHLDFRKDERMKFVTPPEHPKINVLIYGAPKTGKSVGAGTAPGGVLYLNTDLPNATRLVHRRNPGGRIMEPEIPPYEEGSTHVFDLMVEIATTLAKPDQKVIDSVVIDPIGELHRRLLEEHARRAIRPSINLYGDVSVHIARFCRQLCMLPVNVVLVCHELAEKNEATGEIEKIPYTGTKTGSATLGGSLMSMVDLIAYTGVVEQENGSKEYLAQLVPGKGRTGGDRFDCLGDTQPLNVAHWIELIEAHEAKDIEAEEVKKATPKTKTNDKTTNKDEKEGVKDAAVKPVASAA